MSSRKVDQFTLASSYVLLAIDAVHVLSVAIYKLVQ